MSENLIVQQYPCRLQGHAHNTQEEADECVTRTIWLEQFDERQRAEISLDLLYARMFAHGTEGHNTRLIIARMATLLSGGKL